MSYHLLCVGHKNSFSSDSQKVFIENSKIINQDRIKTLLFCYATAAIIRDVTREKKKKVKMTFKAFKMCSRKMEIKRRGDEDFFGLSTLAYDEMRCGCLCSILISNLSLTLSLTLERVIEMCVNVAVKFPSEPFGSEPKNQFERM